MEKLEKSNNKPSNDEVVEVSSNDYTFFDVNDNIAYNLGGNLSIPV